MRDRHHILNSRVEWTLRPHAAKLRGTPSLIPTLDREVHEELHRECPPVPLLGAYALRGTLERFVPTHDVLRDMDGLMEAIERSSRHRMVHPIERDLAGLAIEAIDMQRPYIIDGIIK